LASFCNGLSIGSGSILKASNPGATVTAGQGGGQGVFTDEPPRLRLNEGLTDGTRHPWGFGDR
jgi:hypothetical protein